MMILKPYVAEAERRLTIAAKTTMVGDVAVPLEDAIDIAKGMALAVRQGFEMSRQEPPPIPDIVGLGAIVLRLMETRLSTDDPIDDAIRWAMDVWVRFDDARRAYGGSDDAADTP